MKQIVIENPVINSPFREPSRHFKFTDEGITAPVFIVVCNNTNVSNLVFDYIGGWPRRPNTILVDSQQLESGEGTCDDFKKIADRATALRDGLDTHARLQRELAVLRGRAEKKTRLHRRVELNLEIKRFEAERARDGQHLQTDTELSP